MHLKLPLTLACMCLLSACGNAPSPVPPPPPPDLAAFQHEFEQGVVQVTDNVYAAIGYGLANSIFIEGENGVIVVDTLESRPRAEQALAALREVTDKPVAAIILTHNHADHVFGGQVFLEGREGVPVYAHETLDGHVDRIVSILKDTIYTRSMRMFGQMLPENAATAAGIGMSLDFHMEDIAIARPTHTFTDRLALEIEGVKLELIHAPGETPDQVIVWLPDQELLIPADNIYRAFPNLYTIRGTAYRDVMDWVASLDLMRDLDPAYLVPCHTRPVAGKERIKEVLTAYRDAIQFVHDQTIRGLNAGKTPDELAASIALPPHLAAHPFLQPVYGDVEFSVRGISDGYLGWFNGDAVDLRPLAPEEESRRMMAALEANTPLPQQAREAIQAGNHQWAAQLARHWVRVNPDNDDARQVLAEALEALGAAAINFNARNYYLTQAMEWRGDLTITPNKPSDAPDDLVDSFPIERFMQAMAPRLMAEETLDVDKVACIRFTDIDTAYTIHIRRGVAEIRERLDENADITITTTAETWKRIASRKRNPAMALAAGELTIDTGITSVIQFMGHFER